MPPQSETNCVGQRSMQNCPEKVTSADCNHVKCVLVGDGAVGKTTLVISYTTNGFPTEYVPTAYDNYTVLVMVNNEPIQLQLCDTAGQDDFDLLRPLCYPNTDVFLLCFSIVSPTSFHNVTEKWLPEIRSFCPNVPVILVGTQSDLRSDIKVLIELSQYGEQAISEAEGRTAAKRIGAASYVECSALTQHNLKDVFDIAVKAALVKRGPKSTVVTATGMACVESNVPAVASTSGNRSSQTRSRKSSHHWQSNANNTSRWWKRPFCCC